MRSDIREKSKARKDAAVDEDGACFVNTYIISDLRPLISTGNQNIFIMLVYLWLKLRSKLSVLELGCKSEDTKHRVSWLIDRTQGAKLRNWVE